jgi:transcriptional regulator of acetoin/glycerol metabolism
MRSTSIPRAPLRHLPYAERMAAAAPARGDKAPWPQGACPPLGDRSHLDEIARSHERCQALGVSRIEDPDHSPIPRADLAIALERNRRLHEHAAPVMSVLYEQIERTESMVVLTDALGTVIHAVGDDDFLDRAAKVALRAGANWSESAKGTNAIGTALVNEAPSLVHADEHYLHANQFLTCSAAPILDPRGNILGVLDVSGDFRSYHKHTLALVRMSARMIENRWLTEDFGHMLRLHFHARPEFIGTLMEGIVAVSEGGRIVGANRGALEQLGQSGAALRMRSLEALLGVGVADLIEHGRAQVATPLTLVAADGRHLSGFVRSHWPLWGRRMPTRAPSAAAAVSSLAARPGIEHAAASLTSSADGAAAAAASLPTSSASPASSASMRTEAAPGITPNRGLAELCTGDAQVQALVDKLRCVLDRDVPVLIVGETGTGKELLARAMHAESKRAAGRFVTVNCASMPLPQLEAELFGHDDPGPAPRRREGRPGKIAEAAGGTLFVDEVGELPLALQARLLGVLQQREPKPSRGQDGAAGLDMQLVCASKGPLRPLIERGTFREDLYYRLNGLALRVPPLRERSDLAALVRRVLEAVAGTHRYRLAPEVQALFARHSWPGNVRQLFQVLRTACLVAGREGVIARPHLPDDFIEEAEAASRSGAVDDNAAGTAAAVGGVAAAHPAGAAGSPATSSQPAPAAATAPARLDDIELDIIRRTLDAVGGNISEASKRLGISRNTIYRKLRWNRAA